MTVPGEVLAEVQRLADECGNRPVFIPGTVSVRLERHPLAPVVGTAEIGLFGISKIKIDEDKHEALQTALVGSRNAVLRIEEFPGAMPFVSITGDVATPPPPADPRSDGQDPDRR